MVWDNHRATTAALTRYLAAEVPEFLAFQITIAPVVGLSGCHRILSCMNCQQWLVVRTEFHMLVRAGAHYSLITRTVLHFQHLQWKKKKPPLPFTSGFHLRGDEADWRQLNHRESRESTSKISWFIHNFSPHECWYGDVSIWWDRSGVPVMCCTEEPVLYFICLQMLLSSRLSHVVFRGQPLCYVQFLQTNVICVNVHYTRQKQTERTEPGENAVWISTPRRAHLSGPCWTKTYVLFELKRMCRACVLCRKQVVSLCGC